MPRIGADCSLLAELKGRSRIRRSPSCDPKQSARSHCRGRSGDVGRSSLVHLVRRSELMVGLWDGDEAAEFPRPSPLVVLRSLWCAVQTRRALSVESYVPAGIWTGRFLQDSPDNGPKGLGGDAVSPQPRLRCRAVAVSAQRAVLSPPDLATPRER